MKSPCSEVAARHWHTAKVLNLFKDELPARHRELQRVRTLSLIPSEAKLHDKVSPPAPSTPLQIGRAYAGRAGSIMRFSEGDAAPRTTAMSQSKKQQAAQGGFRGLHSGKHRRV